MPGRNKRAAVAFLRQVQHAIWRAQDEAEERRSRYEWQRSGLQGLRAEIAYCIEPVSVVLIEDWKGSHQILHAVFRYRGNGLTIDILAAEVLRRRNYVVEHCFKHGRQLLRYPCRHPQRPVRRMIERPLYTDSFEAMAGIPAIRLVVPTVMCCPDCDAVVG